MKSLFRGNDPAGGDLMAASLLPLHALHAKQDAIDRGIKLLSLMK